MAVAALVRRAGANGLLVAAAMLMGSAGCGDDSSSSKLSTGGDGDGLCGAETAEGSDICPASAPGTKPNCDKVKGSNTEVCGVIIKNSSTSTNPMPLTRSSTVNEYGGSGAPDLSCLQKSNWKQPGQTQTVKMVGFARNFSNGCDPAGVKIEVFTVKRTGGTDDGELGELIGTPVVVEDITCDESTPEICELVEVATKCESNGSGARKWRRFTYEGLPTETELLIRTGSKDGQSNFAPLYDYNIIIPNEEVQNGEWHHDVRAVVISDYSLIPTVAYGQTITNGYGVIAGEVHDCGDVRLSNAAVDVTGSRYSIGYFDENEDAPLPDPNRKGTSALGLYAAFDIKPGPVRVAAMGEVDGKPTALGYYDVRVFPDAVTSLTFRGFRALQTAAAKGELAAWPRPPVMPFWAGLSFSLSPPGGRATGSTSTRFSSRAKPSAQPPGAASPISALASAPSACRCSPWAPPSV